VSETFGFAILLNKNNKMWRRNYDLAHELFHILTWNVFRKGISAIAKPTELEEKLADAFASRLLLPTDSVKERVDGAMGSERKIGLEKLHEIAREFGVSLDALLWRMVYLYNMPAENVQKYIQRARSVESIRPARHSDIPDELPERYCSLAIRALKEGRLSMMQFAKYMDISYSEAQEYLTDEESFTGEKISISVA
jgi:Zn-dependent peptidase ImmA (M78 family)